MGLALGVLVVLYGMFRLGVHVVQYPPAPHVKEGKIHIACVGDSITYGAGVFRASAQSVLSGIFAGKFRRKNIRS